MKASVIGSGIAGIACSIRLAKQGYEVHVYEANAYAGGKLREFVQDGYRFDAGPSLLTLPALIDEIFLICGRNPRDYFNYRALSVLCNYFYEDGTTFSTFADGKQTAAAIAHATGEPAENIINYLDASRSLYQLTEPVFLKQSLHRVHSYLSAAAWRAFFRLYKLDALQTLHQRNRSSFQSEKVIQLFDRYATYNGSDPYKAPATLKVIPHLEYDEGAYFPVGGMYEIVRSLVKLAEETGVQFHYHSAVEKILIDNKTATGVQVNGGNVFSDITICNMDVVNAYKKLLAEESRPRKVLDQPRSTSALVFYWGMKKQFSKLDLHNIFFSNNYKAEFDFLTNRKALYNDPTVYVNISSKLQPHDAPSGGENWFTMINAPHVDRQDWQQMVGSARSSIINKISRMLGENVAACIENESVLDPQRIESETSSYLGALYGSSSNNRLAAFLRHKNFSSRIKNLYFCGGSVHPGGGIPLCLMSAKIVSDLVSYKKR